jgi:hypothetical protein
VGESVEVGARVVGPSPLDAPAAFVSRGVSVLSTSINAQQVTASRCPAIPPLVAPVSLLLNAGASDLFVTGIDMHFVDRFSVREPLRSFGHRELVDQFGSTLVPAFGRRTFAFSFPFGCVTAPTGTLAIVIVVSDSSRRETTTRLDVLIR